MTTPFKLESADINRLNDIQLTQLLKELLHSEAFKAGIAQQAVEVALNIRVGDGGEDGRISWNDGPDRTDYIPNRLSMFQNKATEMTAGDMAMNQSCYALKGKDGIPQKFLFLLTKNQVEYLKKNTGGATFDTIVTDTFKRMYILAPSPDLITDFSRIIEFIFDAILNLTKKNEVLRIQRNLLLPKLVSGNIQLQGS